MPSSSSTKPSILTRVMKRELPGTIVYEDNRCAAIADIKPEAPKHFLVVPRKEIPSLNEATIEDEAVLGHLMLVAAQVAREQGFSAKGYRVVINIGMHGGQTIDHLHVHVLGGRPMDWPPG